MKKIFILLIIFSSPLLSQISIALGPMVTLVSPTVDYSGETTDFYAGTKYSLRSGVGYGVNGKIRLGPINAKLSISFASLNNEGQAEIDKPNSKAEVKNSLFMFTIGTDYGFSVPGSPIKPYFGLDILFTSISGSFRFQGTSNVNSNTNNIQSASRTGLGINGGLEIKVAGVTSIDLSLHYNLHNLFGKEYTSGANRIDAYTSLNDAKDPNYSATDEKHPIGNDRTIATIQFQIGILFGF